MEPETIEFICLANSRKYHGRCVAGLRTDGAGWIRPIGGDRFGTLEPRHYTLPDRTHARLLDLLRVTFDAPHPQPYQPENRRITAARWRLVARPAPPECAAILRGHLTPGPALLGDTSAAIPLAVLERRPAPASLTLVRPEAARWFVREQVSGKRQTRVRFTLAGPSGAAAYDLPVTDPVWEHRLRHLPPGEHPRAAAGLDDDEPILLTISLGEPFEGRCYKLAAAVIVPPPALAEPLGLCRARRDVSLLP